MKTLTHKKHKLVNYDSIEELPINRFQAFNKWLMLESGIGSDHNAINQRLNNIAQFVNLDKKDEALKEVANLSQAISFVIGELSPDLNAFICLCDSIDGRKVNDLTDEGIKGYVEILSKTKAPVSLVGQWLNEAKKKLMAN